jgi:hypothetical protein
VHEFFIFGYGFFVTIFLYLISVARGLIRGLSSNIHSETSNYVLCGVFEDIPYTHHSVFSGIGIQIGDHEKPPAVRLFICTQPFPSLY